MTDKKEDCVFCQKVAKSVTDDTHGVTLHPSYRPVSFEPINPVTPGHRLFIPAYHVEHRDGFEAAFALSYAVEAASEYAQEKGVDFNLITSCGPAATQTIPHIHVHYIPRYDGDSLPLPWTPTP